MKIAMISQPMNGLSSEEIEKVRDKAIAYLKKKGYEVADTYFKEDYKNENDSRNEEIVHLPINFLARSLEKMSRCDAVYFCKGWEKARGCRVEHSVAFEYGLDTFYETE